MKFSLQLNDFGRAFTQHQALLKFLIKRDISSRFKGSIFGILWTIMSPIMMLLVYSFVFEEIRKRVNPSCLNWGAGLIKGEGHPIINSQWGAYIDHLKGGRKHLGKSKASDLIIQRTESYWRTNRYR